MSDWDTTTYLTKSHAKKGSSTEKTQVRQAQRSGTLETRQKMFAGTNNKGNTAGHDQLVTKLLTGKKTNWIFTN